MPRAPGYYRHPTIHRDRIVFVCEDDLWSVTTCGGPATRLTASAGSATFPVLSPDGKTIAFTGQDDGPTEAWVMDTDSGTAERRSHFGGMLRTVAWTPDSDNVVVQSHYGQAFRSDLRLWHLPALRGHPRALPHGPSKEIAYHPRSSAVVLGINAGDPARWKRYRGGTAGTLWIDRTGKGSFEPLIELAGNLAAPMWIGSRVFFLSDHEGHGNLYSCTATGRGLQRHTSHQDFYVRFPRTDGKRIVYQHGADLRLFDPRTDEDCAIDVELPGAAAGRARRFVAASRNLESAALHPAGHTLICSARGGAYTLPLWEGAPARLGQVSKARYRLPSFLPDGKRALCVSDETGEEKLTIVPVTGPGRPRRLATRLGHVTSLAVAPRGKIAAVCNHEFELALVDLESGKRIPVDKSDWERIRGMSWSQDGRWLAYGLVTSRSACQIRVWDTRRKRSFAVTSGDFWDTDPAFDPRGKYLYFVGQRFYDPVYDAQYFDLGFPRGARPMLVPLGADEPSPFATALRMPRAPGAKPADADKGAKKRGAPPVRIDFDGIADRVVAFPVPEGRYVGVMGASGRALFLSSPVEGSLGTSWADGGEPAAKAKLEAWDFAQDKAELVVQGVTAAAVTGDGKTLLVRVGNRLRVLPASTQAKALSQKPKPSRESGWIDLRRLRAAVEPTAEWRQMFLEAWRLQRDFFWTSDMSKIDWQAVRDRYLPLVDRVSVRSEFSDLMWEMQGELGTSHAYELGGDYRPAPAWHQGFLGADLGYTRGAWRVQNIPRGDSWIADAASPLAAPGVGIRKGDAIVGIAGTPLSARVSPQECLVHEAGREVALTVNPAARGTKQRQVTVKTLRSELGLRYRAWVEHNRSRVHDESGGRIGYVHVPNMGPVGYSEFHRYYKHEVDCDGLLVDVRWNGGGHVSQLLLEKLLRKRIGYGLPRWRGVESYPEDAPMGPMACLTNEYAGSDGDVFSHAWKLYELGPLIGKRTWGGVIGIWPRHALVDGTITTQPEYSTWFEDVGFGVENYGTDPDIPVEIRPQDWAAGRDTQLERGILEVLKAVRAQKPAIPKMTKKPRLTPPRLRKPRK